MLSRVLAKGVLICFCALVIAEQGSATFTYDIKKQHDYSDIIIRWPAQTCGEDEEPATGYRVQFCETKKKAQLCEPEHNVTDPITTRFKLPYFLKFTTHVVPLCREAVPLPALDDEHDTGVGALFEVEHLHIDSATPPNLQWVENALNRRFPDYYLIDLCYTNETCVVKEAKVKRDKDNKIEPKYPLPPTTAGGDVLVVKVKNVVEVEKKTYESYETVGLYEPQYSGTASVTNLKVDQQKLQRRVDITWDEPKVKGTGFSQYLVVIESHDYFGMQADVVSGTNCTFPIYATHGSGFEVTVTPLDFGFPVLGSEAATNFTFSGIATPEVVVNKVNYNSINITVKSVTKLEGDVKYLVHDKNYETSTIVIEGLAAFKSYEFSISICYIDGLCGDQFELIVKTNTYYPGPVRHLQVSGRGHTNFGISWSAPMVMSGPVDGYILTIKNLDTNNETRATVDGGKLGHYYIHVSEEQYTRYSVECQAFNKDLMDEDLSYLGVKSTQSYKSYGNVPDRPKITESASTFDSITLWLDWPNDFRFHISTYRVEIDDHITYTPIKYVALKGLKPYTKHTIAIRACEAENEDTCGLPLLSTHETAIGAPCAPEDLTLKNQKKSNISVSWSIPGCINGPSISGYTLTISKKVSGTEYKTVEHQVLEPTVLEHTFSKLEPNTVYRVGVQAYNMDGEEYMRSKPTVEVITTDKKGHGAVVGIVIGSICGVILVAILGFVGYKKFYQ